MKRKTLTRILPFALILSCLPSLASCHGQKGLDPFVMPEEFDMSQNQEITFWSKNDSNINQARVYEDAATSFNKLYPNIKVNIKKYTDYKDIYNDVITNIPTNTTPNLCISYPDHIATYMTGQNVMAPLSELIADDEYGLGGTKIKFDAPKKEEVVSKFLSEGIVKKEQYVLPFMRSSEALYINKDFVEKLGYTIPDIVTWDWVYEVSDKAMEKKEDGKTFVVNDQKTLIPFIYKSTDNMMISALKQKGYDYSDDQGNVLLFNDGTKEILNQVRPHAKLRSFSTFSISSYPANFLNAGQCIFAVDSTAGSTWMGTDAPLSDIHDTQKVKFETVVRRIPQYNVDKPQMISQGPSLCIFNKASNQEVLASWLFAQYLLTNDVQIAYAKTEGYVPVTNKAIQSAEYQDYLSKRGIDNNEHYGIKIDAAKLVIDNIDNTFVTPVFNGSASLRTAAGQLIEEVTKAERRNEAVDYGALFANMTSLYKLDQIKIRQGLIDLGNLPAGSIVLFAVLGVTWVGIVAVFILKKRSSRKRIH